MIGKAAPGGEDPGRKTAGAARRIAGLRPRQRRNAAPIAESLKRGRVLDETRPYFFILNEMPAILAAEDMPSDLLEI